MMKRDLGRMGEEQLRLWAAEAGIVLNPSPQDATGWDFILEWPLDADHMLGGQPAPLDKRPGPPQCLVQVKATDRATGRIDVKLSNWTRFARSPLPCFFLVLEYGGMNTCQAAFLVHVDDDAVRRVLRRVRELDSRESDTALHRRTLSLTWDEHSALPSLDGQGLEAKILAYIGQYVEEYQRRKLALLRTAGYEETTARINLTVLPPAGWQGDSRDLLLDFQLGLVPPLEFRDWTLVDLRFGIPAGGPTSQFESGRIESLGNTPAGRALIVVSATEIDREIRLPASAHVARGEAARDEGRPYKVRLRAPFVDVTWRSDSPPIELTFRVPEVTEAYPLSELHAVADLILLLDAAHHAGASITVRTRLESAPLGDSELTLSTPPSRDFVWWATVVRQAWVAVNALEIRRDLPVRWADLAPNVNALFVLGALLERHVSALWFDFTLPARPEAQNHPWCAPVVVTTRLGDHTVQVAGVAIGHPSVLGETSDGVRCRLHPSEVRIERRRVYIDPEVPESADEALVASLAQTYGESMVVVVPARSG
jgi:hypothetical protein